VGELLRIFELTASNIAATREFDRLLGYKLAFFVMSLVPLLVVIMPQSIFAPAGRTRDRSRHWGLATICTLQRLTHTANPLK
jgi:hypothetical protein